MQIAHINLIESFDNQAARFIELVESVKKHGLQQYVVVRNRDIAKRLDAVDDVTVGPCVRTAITAHCLVPAVDVVHLHDRNSGSAGLLLVLTRSIPFVLSADATGETTSNPITKAVQRRAAGLIDPDIADVATHLQIYRQAADRLRVPMMIL